MRNQEMVSSGTNQDVRFETTSCTAVLILKKGDCIWVRLRQGHVYGHSPRNCSKIILRLRKSKTNERLYFLPWNGIIFSNTMKPLLNLLRLHAGPFTGWLSSKRMDSWGSEHSDSRRNLLAGEITINSPPKNPKLPTSQPRARSSDVTEDTSN